MNKMKCLIIGCGKAGNKITNEILAGDKSGQLVGLFVNTSYNDMANLSKRTDDNTFLFTSTNGSGRDRSIAQSYVKDQIKALITAITNFPLRDNVYIITSADGGTGSGITPMICQLLRNAFDSKGLDRKINLISIMPNQKTDDPLAFENAIGFWNDIVKIRKDKQGNEFSIKDKCLDSIKIVDNTKGKNYSDINSRLVQSLLNSFNMNGVHDEGDIDDKDSFKFNTEKGFSIILNIPSGYNTAKEAIDKAISDCIYAVPDNYNCNYLGISLTEEDYLIEEVRDCFPIVNKTTYRTYNNSKHNTVVLSGCAEPNELITNIAQKLEDLKTGITEDSKPKDLTINIEEDNNNKAPKKPKVKTSVSFSESELDDIASSLDDLF